MPRTLHLPAPSLYVQVSSISCGQYHTMACAISGGMAELYAWGANKDGQLGLDDLDDRIYPCRVPLRDALQPVQVACGGRHTLVLGERGELWSCGCNANGQLGHGTDFGKEPLKRLIAVRWRAHASGQRWQMRSVNAHRSEWSRRELESVLFHR